MEATYTNIFTDIIMPLMPENAEIIQNDYGEHSTASIFWKLNNDKNRPNKRSKTIAIVISREFIEDLNEMPDQMKISIYDKLKIIVQKRLSTFEPDHDTPWNEPGPVEKWNFTSEMLMG